VSYNGATTFFGAPIFTSGTGSNIADAVYITLVDWKNSDRVLASGFDTTAFQHSVFNSVRDISIFAVKLYIMVWFGSMHFIQSPNQDLNFLRDACNYLNVYYDTFNAVLDRIKNHLWYLTPKTVGLAFLDPEVPNNK